MTDRDDSNVVHMGAYAKSGPTRTPEQRARLLADCRDRAADRLATAVAGVMPKVDDALFDLADKAVGIGKQTVYFDAMREVRRRRAEIETAFMRGFRQGFDAKARGERESTVNLDAVEPPATELSLVENDELEESLAVTNAASKIAAVCQDGLLALEQRMALLLNEPNLPSAENPLAPKLICNAFRTALDRSDTETEVKLIVFKLFERALAEEMKSIYEEVNRYLVEKGVLPKIPKLVAHGPRPSRTPSDPVQATTPPDGDAETSGGLVESGPDSGYPPTLAAQAPTAADLLDVLRQLLGEEALSAIPNGGAMGLPLPTPDANTPADLASASVPAPPYSDGALSGPPTEVDPSGSVALTSPGVLQTLTLLQRGNPRVALGGTHALDQASLRAGNVNVLRELKSTEVVNGMSTFDVLTLDVVSMLFDFVLDDSTVPDAMKALIGRLQIPVLKVAMIDRSVFSSKSHPVRRLLDALARLSVGWDEDQGQDDPLYGMIESVVRRVLESFEEDVGIFEELHRELEAFSSALQTRTLKEQDQAAEVIEARERWAESRAVAGSIVQERLAGTEVPMEVEHFLRSQWREVLAAGLANGGEEDQEARSAVQTMEELLWSVRPKTTTDEQHRLVDELPGLLKCLKDGMALIGTKAESERFVSELVRLHAAAVSPEHSDAIGLAPSSTAKGEADPELASGGKPKEAQPATPAPHRGGSVANALATAAPTSREAQSIERAFGRANQAIYEAAKSRPECSGMGTTLVMAVFSDDRVTIAHVGDSRLYRLRDGQFEQMTVDHSLVERLIAQGFFTREEAKQSNNKNYVTRAMGITADEQVDVRDEQVLPADIYLLCSDGLSDLVSPEAMRATLLECGDDLEDAAAYLIHLANDAGGKDNSSVVLARVVKSLAGECGGVKSLEDKLDIVASTDVGRKRSHNEDSVGFDPALGVAILADGMGGYNAGEVASSLAVNMLIEELRRSLAASGSSSDNERAADGQHPGTEESMLEDLVGKTLPDDIVDEFNKMADGLEVGQWVEFRQDNEKIRRARLSWVSPSTGSYLFTDRHGMKVADSTPFGLAAQFRGGSAVVLEDVPLFDRALGSIMSRLSGAASAE